MEHKFDTDSVQLNQQHLLEKPKVKPIYQTTAFTFTDLEDIENFYRGNKGYLYSRVGNPNTDDLAAAVALLEKAPKGVATSSGLSAILVGLLSVLKSGDHIIAPDDIYGGTYELLSKELASFGIGVTFVSFEDKANILKHIQSNTKMLYSESITNPLLRVEDVSSLSQIANEHNLILMIDNTFATPYLCQPYVLGAHLVVHSATKYIGGHSDVSAGVVVGDEELIAKAKTKAVNLGVNLSPIEAWLAVRGLKTLAIRMERHVKNAAYIARKLKEHPAVAKVYYPEFVSDKGNGAIVTIDITNTCDISKFFQSLSWIKIVPTLAGVETSVAYPYGTSHRNLSEEMRKQLGITEGLVRISVGIEDRDDIVQAFVQALDAALL